MKIKGRSPFIPPGTPVLWLSLRRRPCTRCDRKVRLTYWSPSEALLAPPQKDGQCCRRCTRLLRSPGGAPML